MPVEKASAFTCDYMEIPGLREDLAVRGLSCLGSCNGKCPWRQPDVVEIARELSAQHYWNTYRNREPKSTDVTRDELIEAALPYLSFWCRVKYYTKQKTFVLWNNIKAYLKKLSKPTGAAMVKDRTIATV